MEVSRGAMLATAGLYTRLIMTWNVDLLFGFSKAEAFTATEVGCCMTGDGGERNMKLRGRY